jgi:hypothetical protein
MTWDEIAAQAGVALLVVRDGALQRSNPAARLLVEPYGAALDDVLDRFTPVLPGARTTTVRWPSPTGGTRWWDVICYPLEATGSLYVIVDETARYGEDAQALGPLTAQWRLQRLESMTGHGTWQWSVRDGTVLWSESLLDLFGIPRGTALDYAQYRSLLHPGRRRDDRGHLATALRTLEPFTYTHRMVLGDRRTERVFECFGEVFADAAGVPSRVLGTRTTSPTPTAPGRSWRSWPTTTRSPASRTAVGSPGGSPSARPGPAAPRCCSSTSTTSRTSTTCAGTPSATG